MYWPQTTSTQITILGNFHFDDFYITTTLVKCVKVRTWLHLEPQVLGVPKDAENSIPKLAALVTGT